jgi:hypothetical protein
MSLGFVEDGGAGDRGMVNRQATRGHEIYPGSGPRRENPTPACLLLITAESKVTGCADLIWREVRMREYESRDLGHALLAFIYTYAGPGHSPNRLQVLGFYPFEFPIYASLALNPKASWALATRKSSWAGVYLPWASLELDQVC